MSAMDVQRALELEVKAYDKVYDELFHLCEKFRRKHERKVKKKEEKLNQILGDYQREEDAHEAYGWGYITYEEYKYICEVIRGNAEKADVDSVDIVMSRIFAHLASDTLKLFQELKYESLSDEERLAWDESVNKQKERREAIKKKSRSKLEES